MNFIKNFLVPALVTTTEDKKQHLISISTNGIQSLLF